VNQQLKTIILALVVITGIAETSQASQFKSGNLAILRVQDVSGALTGNGTPLYLDEYTTNGTLVQTINIPASGANALVSKGTAVSDSVLNLTPNGRWLCFGGYSVAAGLTNISASLGSQAPRGVATMDATGTFNLVATSTIFFNTNTMRGGLSDGTNNFWGFGAVSDFTPGGLVYYGFNQASSVVWSNNVRVVQIFNGELYYCVSAAIPHGIYKFTGTPMVLATNFNIIDTGTNSSPYGFAINKSNTIAYVADDSQTNSGGVQRWTNSAGAWSLAYTLGTGIANTGARGLTVDWSGSNPIIYASTSDNSNLSGDSSNRVIRIVDSGSNSAAITLAVENSGGSFRGIAFTPTIPLPTLGIASAGNQSVLFWPASAGTNLTLQSTTNLASPNWVTVSNGTSIIGVSVTNTVPATFYRLAQ
jgi:hypothetical protein